MNENVGAWPPVLRTEETELVRVMGNLAALAGDYALESSLGCFVDFVAHNGHLGRRESEIKVSTLHEAPLSRST